jgi:hypothetical protein
MVRFLAAEFGVTARISNRFRPFQRQQQWSVAQAPAPVIAKHLAGEARHRYCASVIESIHDEQFSLGPGRFRVVDAVSLILMEIVRSHCVDRPVAFERVSSSTTRLSPFMQRLARARQLPRGLPIFGSPLLVALVSAEPASLPAGAVGLAARIVQSSIHLASLSVRPSMPLRGVRRADRDRRLLGLALATQNPPLFSARPAGRRLHHRADAPEPLHPPRPARARSACTWWTRSGERSGNFHDLGGGMYRLLQSAPQTAPTSATWASRPSSTCAATMATLVRDGGRTCRELGIRLVDHRVYSRQPPTVAVIDETKALFESTNTRR